MLVCQSMLAGLFPSPKLGRTRPEKSFAYTHRRGLFCNGGRVPEIGGLLNFTLTRSHRSWNGITAFSAVEVKNVESSRQSIPLSDRAGRLKDLRPDAR